VVIARNDRPGNAIRIDQLADLVTPMAIRTAASLRLADLIDRGICTAGELAAETGAHEPSLAALVGHLVHAGVFAAEDGRLGLTRLGKQLKLAQRYLDADNSVGRAELSLVRLPEAVRQGQAAYPLLFGRTFWADLESDQRLRASFDEMTDQHLATEIGPLLAAYDWPAVRHFVDLGSGNGAFPIRLLSEFGQLTGTIVELPGRDAAARQSLAQAGLQDRCQVIACSFFESMRHLPRGTFMLCSVLHDWNDEDTARILRRCAEALAPAGRLLIVDSFTEGSADTDMDLRMLALFGGRQRTLADMSGIAESCGLRIEAARRLRKKWLLELTCDTKESP
jgi:SAM-dependent methyltransferase